MISIYAIFQKEDSPLKARDDDKSDDELLDSNKSMQDFLDYLSKLGSIIQYDNQVDNSHIFVVKIHLENQK